MEEPKPKRRKYVYVPNRSRHDFTAARPFGDLKFITRGIVSKAEVAYMDRVIEEALQDSQPDDYVLPTSASIISCLLACAFAKRHGRVNFLIYLDGDYIKRTLLYSELVAPA